MRKLPHIFLNNLENKFSIKHFSKIAGFFVLLFLFQFVGRIQASRIFLSPGGNKDTTCVKAEAGADQLICVGDNAIIGGYSYGGGTGSRPYSYTWSSIPAGFTSTSANPTVSPTITTTYILRVDQNNIFCHSSDEVIVHVKPKVNILFNGGFEKVSPAPLARGAIQNAAGWLKATGNADLFDSAFTACSRICGSADADYNCIGIPCNHLGIRTDRTAQSSHYAGLLAGTTIRWDATGTTPIIQSTVEGIETQIPTLDPNKKYNIKLWVAKAQKGDVGNGVLINLAPISPILFHNPPTGTDASAQVNTMYLANDECSNVVIKLSHGFVSDPAYNPVAATSILTTSVCSNNWVLLTISNYSPSAPNFDHLIIESAAYNDLANAMAASAPASEHTSTTVKVLESYFYIDDVSVEEVCANPYPSIDAGPDMSICKGSTTNIGGNTASGGTPPYTYSWSPPSGVVSPNIYNPTVSPLNTTTYTVVVTDKNNYTTSDQVVVHVSDMSDFNIGPNTSICSSQSITIGQVPHNGVPPYTYLWHASTGANPANIAQPTVSPANNTTYSVTVTDAAGCTVSSAITITVISTPQASINSHTDPLCNGNLVNLQGNVSAQPGQVLQTEWIANGVVFGYNLLSVNVSPTITTAYQFKVIESLNGCNTIANTTLNVPTQLLANAGGDQQICNGGSITITGSASGGTPGISPPYRYSWSNGSIIVSTNASFTTSTSGIYTLTVSDGSGCTASNSMILSNYIPPVANAGGDKHMCLGESRTLGATHSATSGTAGYTYLWSPSTYLDNATSPHPTSTPTSAGTITYTVTVTDNHSCTATDKTVYTVNQLPCCTTCADITANAGGDRSICLGTNTTLGGSPSVSGGSGPYTYTWSPATGLNSTTIANPVASGLNSDQTYTLTVNYSCTTGTCLTSRTSVDVVTVHVSNLTLGAGYNPYICPGFTATIGNQASNGLKPYTYVWTPPGTGSDYQETVSPNATTTYIEQVIDAAGCVKRDSFVVNVNQTLEYSPSNVNVCKGTGGTTIGTTATGGTAPYSYHWAPVWGLSSTSATPHVDPTITSTYPVTIYDSKGCGITGQVVVYVNPLPYIYAGDNQALCKGDSVKIGNLAVGGTGTVYSYSWIPSLGLNNAGIASPKASPSVTTTYTVVVTDINGCTASSSLVITVIPSPTANAGPPKAICNGNCVTIGNTSITGVGPFTYYWTPSAGLDSVNNATPKACPSITTTYRFTVTGANLCSKTDSVVVQVFNSPEYVCNGTFEDGTKPRYRGDIDDATCWQEVTGTPDLFDANFNSVNNCLPILGNLPNVISCGTAVIDINCIGVPCNHFGYENNHTLYGQRYAGLYAALGQINVQGTRLPKIVVEGMGSHLTKPLIKGRKYELSFWMARATKGETDDKLVIPVANYKVKMTTGKNIPTNTLFRPVNLPAKFSGYETSTTWVKKVHEFIADSAYTSLIIESDIDSLVVNYNVAFGFVVTDLLHTFYLNVDSASSNASIRKKLENGIQSYFYIDDVSIVEDCDTVPPLIVNAGSDTTMCIGSGRTLGGLPTAAYGTPGYTYLWSASPPQTFSPNNTVANPDVTPTATSTYTVTVTDASSTKTTSSVVLHIFIQSEYIVNGGFETGPIPTVRGDIEMAPMWKKATGDADLYDSLFTNCPTPLCGNSPADYNCIELPCNHFGFQHHRTHTGHRYGGLWSLVQLGSKVTVGGGGVNGQLPRQIIGPGTGGGQNVPNVPSDSLTQTYQIAVEGIEINFTPGMLDTSKTYELSFYVSRAEKGETGRNVPLPGVLNQIDGQHLLVDSCAGFDVKFSNTFATNILYQPVNRPIKMSGVVCDTLNWQYVSYVFKPDSAYNYLIIESYPTNGLKNIFSSSPINNISQKGITTPSVTTNFHAAGFQSYFYIDDVSFKDLCDTAKPKSSGSRIGHFIPNPYRVISTGGNQAIMVTKTPTELVQLYPNPNSGQFTLVYNSTESLSKPLQVVVYNLLGTAVKTMSINTQEGPNTINIDMNSNVNGLISEGIYLVRVLDGKQEVVKRISVIAK